MFRQHFLIEGRSEYARRQETQLGERGWIAKREEKNKNPTCRIESLNKRVSAASATF